MRATTRWEAIEELVDLLAEKSPKDDKATIVAKIKDRENLTPHGTYIQGGIALPHYSGAECTGAHIAIGKLSEPIDWARDETCPTPVQIVVLSVWGGSKEAPYFFLARIAQILGATHVRDAIRAAPTASEVRACLVREDEVVAQAETLQDKGVKLWKTLR
jgi:mannitol/fructose-specific phosphotransferase system IIA component (Ntr-type)